MQDAVSKLVGLMVGAAAAIIWLWVCIGGPIHQQALLAGEHNYRAEMATVVSAGPVIQAPWNLIRPTQLSYRTYFGAMATSKTVMLNYTAVIGTREPVTVGRDGSLWVKYDMESNDGVNPLVQAADDNDGMGVILCIFIGAIVGCLAYCRCGSSGRYPSSLGGWYAG